MFIQHYLLLLFFFKWMTIDIVLQLLSLSKIIHRNGSLQNYDTSKVTKWPFWKSFEGKDDSTLPFMPRESIHCCTKLYTSWERIIDHLVPNIHLLGFLQVGGIWTLTKYLTHHKVGDIRGSKPKFLKWEANELCAPLTSLFDLVAKEGFLGSWTINTIQMIFKSSERRYEAIGP